MKLDVKHLINNSLPCLRGDSKLNITHPAIDRLEQ